MSLESKLENLASLIRQLQGALGGNRIIRGTVSSAGAIVVGSGFTVSRTGVGQYTVTFTTAFADHPTVTLGAGITVANYAVKLTTRSATAIAVNTITIAAAPANVDAEFSFIAIGPG